MSPHRYRIAIEGELGPRCASAFDDVTLCAHHGVKEITGPIIDPVASSGGPLERIAGTCTTSKGP